VLEWDETEFTGCLEVIPERIEDTAGGPFYVFNVSKKGIQLELTIFPFEEDVRFRLFRVGENHVLFEYQIMGCKFARYETNKHNEEYLSFVNSGDLETTVSVNPDIQILLSE